MKNSAQTLMYPIVMCLLFVSCAPKDDKEAKEKAAMIDRNKNAAQKIFDTFNTGNSDSLTNYITENYIEHQPIPDIKTTGAQGFKDITNYYRTAFPDLKVTTSSIIAEGDLVVVMYHTTGKNSGPMGTMRATNKSVEFDGNDIFKFSNGKVVEHWGYFEESKFLTQMGMLGQPSAETKK